MFPDFSEKIRRSNKIMEEVERGYSERLIMTSSFGSLSAGPLHFVNDFGLRVPVINIRDSNETLETREHRKTLRDLLDFPEFLIVDKIESKVKSFKNVIRDYNIKSIISGVRWDESGIRKDFDYFMEDIDLGIIRIHPFLDWTEIEMINYLEKNHLPFNLNYYDSEKEKSPYNECGIHDFSREKGD